MVRWLWPLEVAIGVMDTALPAIFRLYRAWGEALRVVAGKCCAKPVLNP